MIIANIEPLMKEIQEAKDKSIFDSDVSMCFVLSVLEKYLRDAKKIEMDPDAIIERWNHECVEVSDKKIAHENLFIIFRDTIDRIKVLEEEEEDPA